MGNRGVVLRYAKGYNESHMNYYSVASRVLSDRHVPFDIIILGYPRAGYKSAADTTYIRRYIY